MGDVVAVRRGGYVISCRATPALSSAGSRPTAPDPHLAAASGESFLVQTQEGKPLALSLSYVA